MKGMPLLSRHMLLVILVCCLGLSFWCESFQLPLPPSQATNKFTILDASSPSPGDVSSGPKRISQSQKLSLKKILAIPLVTPFLIGNPVVSYGTDSDDGLIRDAKRPFVYGVDFTDPPCLIPRTRQGEEGVLEKFCKSDIVLLGKCITFHFVCGIINHFFLIQRRTSWIYN